MQASEFVLGVGVIISTGGLVYFLYEAYTHKRDLGIATQMYSDITTSFESVGTFAQRVREGNREATKVVQELTDVLGRLYPSDIRGDTRLTELRGAV